MNCPLRPCTEGEGEGRTSQNAQTGTTSLGQFMFVMRVGGRPKLFHSPSLRDCSIIMSYSTTPPTVKV